MPCPHAGRSRREFLGLLGVGVAAVTTAAVATACTPTPPEPPGPAPADPAPAGTAPAGPPSVGHPPAGPPPTGRRVLHHGPSGTRDVALTVDDGTCADCVAGYVEFAHRTGIHLTFSPNAVYDREWAPHAPVLRPLIEAGQVQLMNHTFHHLDLTAMPAPRIREELETNDAWIERTFGTTTPPYYRPPFGRHSAHVQAAAAAAGYEATALWYGSFSDSKLITPEFLMQQATRYLQPGALVIGHANHPTVLGLFDQILELIKQRDLHPVTVDEMFGTRRPTARN